MGDGQTENTATWKLKTSPDIVQESSSLKLSAWLLNPIWPRGGHIVPPLSRMSRNSVMSLEKGSTLFTP